MTDQKVLYLPDSVLESLGLGPSDIADSIEAAFAAQAQGQLWTVPKSAIMPGDGRYMMTTLSVSDAPQFTVIKTATVSPRNPDRGLNGIEAAIILLDSETGLLRAVMGGNWITATRTAALSAVMGRRLANPESRSIAFVGCGVQARSHLDAFAAEFPISEIRMLGRGQANIDRLSAKAKAMGLSCLHAENAQQAIEGADIVVSSITLSYDTAPFLDAHWLKPGAFAAITDLGIPWIQDSLVALDHAYIDDHAQEASSPKPMIASQLIKGDMAQVLSGDVKAKFDPTRSAAFLFRGMAIGDYAAAALAYQHALDGGSGTALT